MREDEVLDQLNGQAPNPYLEEGSTTTKEEKPQAPNLQERK